MSFSNTAKSQDRQVGRCLLSLHHARWSPCNILTNMSLARRVRVSRHIEWPFPHKCVSEF